MHFSASLKRECVVLLFISKSSIVLCAELNWALRLSFLYCEHQFWGQVFLPAPLSNIGPDMASGLSPDSAQTCLYLPAMLIGLCNPYSQVCDDSAINES